MNFVILSKKNVKRTIHNKTKFFIYTFAISIILFSSCANPENETLCLNGGYYENGICHCNEGNVGDQCQINLENARIKKITRDNEFLTEFEYDSNGNITNEIRFDVNGEAEYEMTFLFLEDTLLQEIRIKTGNEWSTTTLKSYEIDDNLFRYDMYNFIDIIGNYLINWRTINFQEQCGPIEEIVYLPTDELWGTIKWNYNESNCDWNSNFTIPTGEIYASTEIKTDNSFITMPTLLNYRNRAKQGIIIEKVEFEINEDGILELSPNSYSSDIIYNEFDLPEIETRTKQNGNIEIFEYEYVFI